MFLTVHAAAAVIIGKKVASAPLAFILAIISHFLLDMIPHGDQEMGKKFFGMRFKSEESEAKTSFKHMALYGVIDIFILIIFILALFRNYSFVNTDSVVWAILGAILPDALVGIFIAGNVKKLHRYFHFHAWIHHIFINHLGRDIPLRLGILLQICLFILCLFGIYYI